MRILKLSVIVLLVIVILVLFAAWFLPSTRHVEDFIYIKGPSKYAYEQVIKLKNWDKWSPFAAEDTAMKTYYDGPPQGVGAIMKWESKKQGNGTMTIIEADPGKYIKMKMEFEGQGVSYSDWRFIQEGDSTQVIWAIDILNMKYPIGRLLGIFMPGVLHKSFQSGLAKLKKVTMDYAAAMTTFKTSEIKIKDLDKQYALVITDSSKCSEVDIVIGKVFGEVMQYVEMNKIECTAPPFVRYLVWDEKADRNVIEGGIFIKGPVAGKDNIKFVEYPAQKVVSATHYGAYETISNTYQALEKYMKDHNLTSGGAPFEIYITDPQKEPEMTKWETEVYFPIK